MSEATRTIWFQVIEPAHESTGGIAQTSYCLVCGAAIVIVAGDTRAAALHIEWHTSRGEAP